jgi:hypothetical protein
VFEHVVTGWTVAKVNAIPMRWAGMAWQAGAGTADDAGDEDSAGSRDGARAVVRNDADAVRVVPAAQAAQAVAPRHARRWSDDGRARALRRLGLGFIVAGCCIVLWIGVLAAQLPLLAEPANWNDAWIGLDALEAAGLLSTGLLLRRQDPRMCVAAAATSMLLFMDAWFDVMTAAPGERVLSVLMAVVAELPVGSLCAALALRHIPGLTTRP